jgi:hypothetical protein
MRGREREREREHVLGKTLDDDACMKTEEERFRVRGLG